MSSHQLLVKRLNTLYFQSKSSQAESKYLRAREGGFWIVSSSAGSFQVFLAETTVNISQALVAQLMDFLVWMIFPRIVKRHKGSDRLDFELRSTRFALDLRGNIPFFIHICHDTSRTVSICSTASIWRQS